ncbi:MAG: lactate racemase domain-containing protein [Promethearchaeota archaeon]
MIFLYKAIIPYESFEERGVTLELEIPEENLAAVAIPRRSPIIEDVEKETLKAAENPIAGPRFSDMIGSGVKIALIVDNQFRSTPAHLMVPPLLDKMEDAGAEVNLIFACGAVPPLGDKEIKEKVGTKVIERLGKDRIFNNEAREKENYLFQGFTPQGTPVWVHKVVALSDAKIGIGIVQPEPFAGYGGGGKIILPGVCSFETIEINHMKTLSPWVYPGNLDNAMRADIDDAADLAGLDMVINVVQNVEGNVTNITAGEPRQTFRKCVEEYNKVYAIKTPTLAYKKADITITGTNWPTDHLLFHTGWAVNNLDRITKEGGTIIQASPCPGYGEWPGFALMDLMKDYMPPTPENHEKALRDIFQLKREMWSGCIWYKLYELLTRKEVVFVTKGENVDMGRDVGLAVTTSMQEAFDKALEKHGKTARVAYVPYGKWTVPIL